MTTNAPNPPHEQSELEKPSKLWFIWRLIPHSHGTKNMQLVELYPIGQYEIWECRKCKFQEAL